MKNTILLTLVLGEFPASEAFDRINDALSSSDVERKKAIKDSNAVFAFKLTNNAGKQEAWHIDLKNTGLVGNGMGDNPTGKSISN